MTQFKKYLVAACCIGVLTITGALINTHHAVAQAPTQVAVVNTPLPITGDVHIAASTHRPLAVEIAHSPVPVLNVNEPGRAPYQELRQFQFGVGGCTSVNCIVIFSPVPAGKRLVVTQIYAYLELTPGPSPLVLLAFSGIFSAVAPAIKQVSGPGFDIFAANQAVLAYYDSSAPPVVSVSLVGVGSPGGATSRYVGLAGYYVGL